jgi:hypothetical protein
MESISLIPVNGDNSKSSGGGDDDGLAFLANINKSDITPDEDGNTLKLNIKDVGDFQSNNNSKSDNITMTTIDIGNTNGGIEPINFDTTNSNPINLIPSSTPTIPKSPSVKSVGITSGATTPIDNSFKVLPNLTQSQSENNNNNTTSFKLPSFGTSKTPITPSTFKPVASTSNSMEDAKKKHAQEIRDKLYYLNRLEMMREKGIKVRQFSTRDSLEQMKEEFERVKSASDMKKSIFWQRQMLLTFISTTEMLNSEFDPFGIDLEGWTEKVHEEHETFDDILEDLYEKWKDRINVVSPEFKLMFALAGSGYMVHLNNKMAKKLMGIGHMSGRAPQSMPSNRGGGGGGGGGGLGGMLNGVMNMFGMGGSGDDNEEERKTPVNERMENFNGMRPDMKGPSDMADILASIETGGGGGGGEDNNHEERQSRIGAMSVLSENPLAQKRNHSIEFD